MGMGLRVITYDAGGRVLSDFTSSADSSATPEHLATNSLDLPGTAVSKVWAAGADLTEEPVLVMRQGEQVRSDTPTPIDPRGLVG
jgi:hypothetical protein